MWRVLATCVLLALAGCGDGGVPLVAVRGQVTLDGKPLAAKTVRFIPVQGTPGQGAGGNTDKDGNYTLLSVRPGATQDTPGVPPGEYRVVVTEPMFPIDLPVQKSSDTEATPAIGPPSLSRKKQEIPAAYGNPEATPLKIEVPKGGGVIDLKLTKGPVR